MNKRARVIALYLPQYHPTPNNDIWWGKGFTEWTNVCKARPLFRGHYQPHVPADLGFYDLRLSQSRVAQAEMAKKYGVEGFCYYHYWFDKDRRELELPFEDVLKSGEPDFPFMLCWANESWHAKFWDKDGVSSKKMLVEQKYGGIEDYTKHFYHVLPAFRDSRYIRIHNKPAFMIYRPLYFDEVDRFIQLWQKLARENGLEGIFFIGQTTNIEDSESAILDKGFDAINTVKLLECLKKRSFIEKVFQKIYITARRVPHAYPYKKAMKYFIGTHERKNNIYPTIIPNWDHSPRSGINGSILTNSTPHLFGKLVKNTMDAIRHKPLEERIVFIRAWNEWGEGNHMEPDLKYGTGYLEALRDNLE